MRAWLWLWCLVLACAACVDDDSAAPSVVEACGARPLRPGWVVGFDGDTASMSVADYTALNAWADAIAAWADCAEDVGR